MTSGERPETYEVAVSVSRAEGDYTDADRDAVVERLSVYSPRLVVDADALRGVLTVPGEDLHAARLVAEESLREALSSIGRSFGVMSALDTSSGKLAGPTDLAPDRT